MPAVTIRLTGELRPGPGDGRRGAGSGFGRQRPSTPTVVSGWGTPGRRSTSKRRDCRSGRGGRAVRPRPAQPAQRGPTRVSWFGFNPRAPCGAEPVCGSRPGTPAPCPHPAEAPSYRSGAPVPWGGRSPNHSGWQAESDDLVRDASPARLAASGLVRYSILPMGTPRATHSRRRPPWSSSRSQPQLDQQRFLHPRPHASPLPTPYASPAGAAAPTSPLSPRSEAVATGSIANGRPAGRHPPAVPSWGRPQSTRGSSLRL